MKELGTGIGVAALVAWIPAVGASAQPVPVPEVQELRDLGFVTVFSTGIAISRWDPWASPEPDDAENRPSIFPDGRLFTVGEFHVFLAATVGGRKFIDRPVVHQVGYRLHVSGTGRQFIHRHTVTYRALSLPIAVSIGMGPGFASPLDRSEKTLVGLSYTGSLEVHFADQFFVSVPVVAFDYFPGAEAPLMSVGVALGVGSF